MKRQQAVEVDQKTKEYLQQNKIRPMFADLVRAVVLNRPQDPISYMINYLDKNPRRLIICLQGYDNEERKRLAKIITNKLNFKLIEVSDLFQNHDYHVQSDEKINEKVLASLKSSESMFKGIVISGYPNNIHQVDFIQKSAFLPDRYFLLPFEEPKIKDKLKSQYSEKQVSHIIKRHQMEKKQMLEGLGEMLDILPVNVDLAAQKLSNAFTMKINKKSLPYESPRVVFIHPPYLCPSTAQQLVQSFYLHHVSIQKSLSKLIKKQNFKDYVEKYIRKSGSLSKQIELALIQTQCKSAAAKNKGFLLTGWPTSKQNLVFLKQKFLSPHLIFVFDLDSHGCQQYFQKLQAGDAQIFPVSPKPTLAQYQAELGQYHKMVDHLKEHYKIQILPLHESWKQVQKTFESLINNPKIYF